LIANFCFRRDSTFFLPASKGNLITRIKSGWHGVERNVDKLLARKKRTALWVVSNCKGGSNAKNRLRLSDELIASGLNLDRFGKCFRSSPLNLAKSSRNDKSFFNFISTYKFYLAFENSLHCKDYISEKFHDNALATGAVPIAFGAYKEDYVAVAPPHSFIHVEDFNTTKELVKYLNYLDKNQTAYAEYLAWRNTMAEKKSYLYGKYLGACALCRTLYGISLNDSRTFAEIYGENGERYSSKLGLRFNQRIRSVDEWWHKSASRDCLNVWESTRCCNASAAHQAWQPTYNLKDDSHRVAVYRNEASVIQFVPECFWSLATAYVVRVFFFTWTFAQNCGTPLDCFDRSLLRLS